MAVHTYKTKQNIPASISEVWEFFSTPSNLQVITPPELDFNIISESEEGIYAGQIIEYTVKPLLGISVYWMTEITHVEVNKYFVDEQRYGPYSMWHHKHYFKEIEGGTEMTDVVHYKVPFLFIGDLANKIIIKDKLKVIFDFRHKAVQKRFGNWSSNSFVEEGY